jgi:hypothetical protein
MHEKAKRRERVLKKMSTTGEKECVPQQRMGSETKVAIKKHKHEQNMNSSSEKKGGTRERKSRNRDFKMPQSEDTFISQETGAHTTIENRSTNTYVLTNTLHATDTLMRHPVKSHSS